MGRNALDDIAQVDEGIDLQVLAGLDEDEHRMAVRCAAASLPANNQFFRPNTLGRNACSAPLLSILRRPSSV